jgi:DNA-binding protein HU-beta
MKTRNLYNHPTTKANLLKLIATSTDTDKRTAAFFLDAIINIAYKSTKKDGEFILPGIGKLVKQKRKARMGIIPKTAAKIKIAAKTLLKFRIAKTAKDKILRLKT